MINSSTKSTISKKRPKVPFVIGLPEYLSTAVGTIPDYSKLDKIGWSEGVSAGHSLGQYLHRIIPNYARLIMRDINERGKGYEFHAFPVPSDVALTDERGLTQEERDIFRETAIAHDLGEIYRADFSNPDNRFFYLDIARALLKEMDEFGVVKYTLFNPMRKREFC